MKLLFTFKFMFLFSLVLMSQQKDAFLEMKSSTFDFGKINESSGLVSTRFEFTNTGKTPLMLTHVKANCGCTTPSYSKVPVLPGEKGFVDVAYNPKNRPGPFDKYITISSNAVNNTLKVNIKGYVIGEVQENIQNPKNLQNKYKFPVGSVDLTTNHMAFSEIDFRSTAAKSMGIYNSSSFPVEITFSDLPDHLNVQAFPALLKPGQEGEIVITYNATKKDDWGFVFDRINIVLKGNTESRTAVSVSANIVEKFEALSDEEKANAPVIQFEKMHHNFDTINNDTQVVCRFPFQNKGATNLIIRKVKASCGCTASFSGDNLVAPGEKSYIEAKFNAAGREGYQSKSITVVTNDPQNSSIVLKFNAFVKSSK